MTRSDRDYDDILSRVLHSTLDPVEPAGDGLAKIQKRIAEPWLKRRVSLVRSELTALAWLIFVRCEPFLSRGKSAVAALSASSRRPAPSARASTAARASSGRHHAAARRGRTGDRRLRRWVGPTMAWLRPTLAVCGAVVIVVAGVFALGQFREDFITPAGNGSPGTSSTSQAQPPKHHSHSGITGLGHASPGSTTGQSPSDQGTSKPENKGTTQRPPTSPAPTSPASSPSPSMSPSPSPTTPTPTTSPTTPTPTNSPTTATGGGGASPTPQPTPGG